MLTVSEAFKIFKSRLELPQSLQDTISTHHRAVREWIESYDPTIKTKLIGSLHPKRKTRINPRKGDSFDIDILVILGSFVRWVSYGGVKPVDALNKLENIIKEHGTYKKMGPETDSPTIIFEYSDGIKVELVPAYLDNIGDKPPKGRGYWVPRRNKWILADYDYDAEYISSMNEKSKGYLIPLIKMLKATKRNLFPKMTSYHLEVLASNLIPDIVQIFEKEGILLSYPLLIHAFFLIAKDKVIEPAIVPGSKSPPADEYLNDEDRLKLSQFFGKLANYCEKLLTLEDRKAIEGWKKLFGEPFPSGG